MSNKTTGPAALFGVARDAVLEVSDEAWRAQLDAALDSALQFERRSKQRGDGREASAAGATAADTRDGSACRVWRGCDQNVALRIQSGPSCGLVALQLAVEHVLRVRCADDSDALLRTAVERHFSKLGEMFSAFHLADLAAAVYGARLASHSVSVHALDLLADSLDARAAWLAAAVQRGALVLLAYDADKDNTPSATLGGSRAHWAVVKGFLAPAPAAAAPESESDSEPLRVLLDADADAAAAVRAADAFFVCVHSKSKRPALWRADALLRSSAQLLRPDHARNTDSRYVMPESIAETLALKAIVIE